MNTRIAELYRMVGVGSNCGPQFPANYLSQKRNHVDESNLFSTGTISRGAPVTREASMTLIEKKQQQKRKREMLRAKYNPLNLDARSLFSISEWMEYMIFDVWRGLKYFEDGSAFGDWLWSVRRDWNMSVSAQDGSGITQGWSVLSRLFVLEEKVRRVIPGHGLYCVHNYIIPKMAQYGILHTLRPIEEYDRLDLLFGLRLLARRWICSVTWVDGIDGVLNLVELLLHDFNLKGLEYTILKNAQKKNIDGTIETNADVEISAFYDRDFVIEMSHMTAFYHHMILTWKKQIRPLLICRDIDGELFHDPSRTFSMSFIPTKFTKMSINAMTWDAKSKLYEKCYENLRTFMREEFMIVAKMGILTRNVYTALRSLLMPYDLYIRYRIEQNRDTQDASIASDILLCRSETNYLDFEIVKNRDDTLLDAKDIDDDRKWIFEFVSISKVGDDLLCQFNLDFHWSANTIIFDRDLYKFNQDNSNRIFSGRLPVIVVFGDKVVFVFQNRGVILRDIYEAFMLWVFVAYEIFDAKVQTEDDRIFDLEAEIRKVLDICFTGMDYAPEIDCSESDSSGDSDSDLGNLGDSEHDEICDSDDFEDSDNPDNIDVPCDEFEYLDDFDETPDLEEKYIPPSLNENHLNSTELVESDSEVESEKSDNSVDCYIDSDNAN